MSTLFQALYSLSFTATDRVRALRDEEKGASAVEYALLVGVLAVVVLTAILLFGEELTTLFGGVSLATTRAS